jgi:hypothetical protein
MTCVYSSSALRRSTAGLFVAGALAFAVAATPLSSTFDWPDVLRRPGDVVLPAVVAGGTSLVWTWFGAAWTYAVLAAAVDAARTAPHQFGGALLGHPRPDRDAHLVLPRWIGVTGLVVSAVYLLDQGDVLATAVPAFPVRELAGLLGSTGWGLWVVALGVAVLRRSAVPAAPDVVPATARRASALRG